MLAGQKPSVMDALACAMKTGIKIACGAMIAMLSKVSLSREISRRNRNDCRQFLIEKKKLSADWTKRVNLGSFNENRSPSCPNFDAYNLTQYTHLQTKVATHTSKHKVKQILFKDTENCKRQYRVSATLQPSQILSSVRGFQ